jgi:xanthine dehydrogenase accessory factor
MKHGSESGLGAVCERMVTALQAGQTPRIDPEDIPCFMASALAGDPCVRPESLAEVLASLSEADIPTLVRAREAINANAQAWLGFKIITDPLAALDSEDTDVVAVRGQGRGSADGRPGLFLVLDPTTVRQDAEVVFGRPFSDRDRFQMLDITRGPQMHDEQYAGVAWKSVPLFRETRLFLMGAGTVAAEVEHLACRVGFRTLVVDFDPAYLNAARFPFSDRILIDTFDAIPDLGIGEEDFVCVLTRGHMHDPQALAHGVQAGAAYVGMMGHPRKNERVFALAGRMGADPAALKATHTPIGLKFGAKSPAELAVSVVAELIQVRQDRAGGR